MVVVTEVTEGEARDGATDHIPDRDIVDECDRTESVELVLGYEKGLTGLKV